MTEKPKKVRLKLECNKSYVMAEIVDKDADGVFVKGKLFENDENDDWMHYIRRDKHGSKDKPKAVGGSKDKPAETGE